MNVATAVSDQTAQPVEHFDVLIVGAGISGVDAAYHLQQHCPNKSFALLEKFEDIGGTWWWHRYPGIRSDSDLFTFGFGWKPWRGVPIATAAAIMDYLNEAVDEQDIRRHIRLGHKVTASAWDSGEKRWTLTVENLETGETRPMTANFLWMCQGYYRHEDPYTPEWPGMNRFQGPIVHPQTWPEDLDYTGKNVLVIGSGATAATIVPAMAPDAAHVTMLQRSPTYFYAKPNRSEMADMLAPLDITEQQKYDIIRKRYLYDQSEVTRRSFEEPDQLRAELLAGVRAYVGQDVPLEPHFSPSYRPWRQRLAVVPEGDLFLAVRAGQASVVTDHIETFTETGILLKSGREIEADIIVTATGFNMSALGDIPFRIDGKLLDYAKCWTHRGIMFSGIPNMAYIFGYFRTSWTMRADLVSRYVCRLLNHMAETGAEVVTPILRPEDEGMEPRELVDDDNFNSGYLRRQIHILPRKGDREPWIFNNDYYTEKDQIEGADLDDGTLVYS